MESKISKFHALPNIAARQLPIKEFAHKAAIIGDDGVSAGLVLTARNMAAKRRRAAALDRTHNLQLAEAHMAGVGLTPRRSEVAEDSRDFESGTNHEYRFIVADQTFCWLAV